MQGPPQQVMKGQGGNRGLRRIEKQDSIDSVNDKPLNTQATLGTSASVKQLTNYEKKMTELTFQGPKFYMFSTDTDKEVDFIRIPLQVINSVFMSPINMDKIT